MPDLQTPLADKPQSPSVAPQPTLPTVDREFTVEEKSQWQQALRRFLRHRIAMVSLVLLFLLIVFAFVGPLFWQFRYDDVSGHDLSIAPGLKHPFGTDNLGTDELAVVMRGAQQSLKIAFSIAFLAVVVGSIWGVVSGYFLGITDSVLMRFADLLLTIPGLALAGALAHNTSGSWWVIALVLGGLSTPYVARVVRGVVLSLREREFVEAARALGATNTRIMFRHLIPNTLAVVIVNATLLVAGGILAETALSFLGLGVKTPDTSLGLLITTAQGAVDTRPWLFYFPGIVIILIALTVNFIGDGLRDALDPRQTRQRR
ncbi:MAG: ABC transporter permease [Pseudonocardiales bacterium]|nr:MAG: ABC transporter permease [Pseudonocardiales bacterium]